MLDVAQHFRAFRIERGDFVHDVLRATVRDFRASARVFHRQIIGGCVNRRDLDAPAFRAMSLGFLQFDKLGQVGIIKRVGLAQVAARVKLIEPDLARGRSFLEKQHHGLDPRALKRAAGAVEYGVQVAAFQ